jgi:hypothetical protein
MSRWSPTPGWFRRFRRPTANAIEDARLTYIIGERISDVPYLVGKWRTDNPGGEICDGQVFVQPWPATATQRAQGRDKVVYYQYRADRGAAPCEGSTSRSPRPKTPSQGRHR